MQFFPDDMIWSFANQPQENEPRPMPIPRHPSMLSLDDQAPSSDDEDNDDEGPGIM